MTAIPNFTLPKLDFAAGKAVAPDAPSSELRLEAPEAAAAGNRGVTNKGNGREFGELLNTRIVKKETGKEGKFDGSGHSETEPVEENAEIQVAEPKFNNSPQITENPSTNNDKEISVKLTADPLLVKTNAEAGVEDGSTDGETATRLAYSGADSESIPSAGKSGNTRPAGEEIALVRSATSGPVDSRPAPIAFMQTDPAANARGRVPFNNAGETGQSTANQSTLTSQTLNQSPVAQAGTTAPVGLNADRPPDSQTSKGLAPAGEAEELMSEPVRQNSSAPSDILSRTTRSVAGQRADSVIQAGDDAAEIAAESGKQLPDSGKPLPSVLLQTPAHLAPGLSSRTELMTRSVGNGRQRSIGKETGEVPGLEKVTQVHNRIPLSEFLGKAVSQVQPTANTETGIHTQTTGSDSQATGLLAQHLAGIERTTTSRTSGPLTGLDTNNSFSLQLQPGSQEMSAQLGSRIRWMSNLNISSAEVKLYPAELGTLEIMITTEDDQARVNFITSTTAAKEMIEASLPRLRELLGQSGLLLEQGDVTHRDLSQNSSDSAVPVTERTAVESLETEALEQVMPMYQRSASDHRIDHFA